MASPAAARGPLQFLLHSSSGQWIVLGCGAALAFPQKAQEIAVPLLQNILSVASNGEQAPRLAAGAAPIIIQTGSDKPRGSSTTSGVIITYVVSAGVCCATYAVVTNMLPETMKQFFPVTRKFFETTAKGLGASIISVRKILEEKIKKLTATQEEMNDKLDDNHEAVVQIQSELGLARDDLHGIDGRLDRCEDSLQSIQRMQRFSSRGIKLLVRCVGTMLPRNDEFLSELRSFVREADEQTEQEIKKEKEEPVTPSLRTSTSMSSSVSRHQRPAPELPSFSTPTPAQRFAAEMSGPSCQGRDASLSPSSRIDQEIHALLGH